MNKLSIQKSFVGCINEMFNLNQIDLETYNRMLKGIGDDDKKIYDEISVALNEMAVLIRKERDKLQRIDFLAKIQKHILCG